MYGHLKKYRQYVCHFLGFAEVWQNQHPQSAGQPWMPAHPAAPEPSPVWKPACLSLKHIVGQTKYARPKLIKTIKKTDKNLKNL